MPKLQEEISQNINPLSSIMKLKNNGKRAWAPMETNKDPRYLCKL
jgi:hypothetical protein